MKGSARTHSEALELYPEPESKPEAFALQGFFRTRLERVLVLSDPSVVAGFQRGSPLQGRLTRFRVKGLPPASDLKQFRI